MNMLINGIEFEDINTSSHTHGNMIFDKEFRNTHLNKRQYLQQAMLVKHD